MDLPLNYLRYFHEVARLGSFTEASRRLHVAQPSVSKMIRLLEEDIGARLIERRRGGGVHLTEKGREVFASCQQVFGELHRLRHSLGQKGNGLSGELLIGASDNLCNYVLPKLIHQCSVRNPGLAIKVFGGTAEAIRVELAAGRSELGFFYNPLKDPALAIHHLTDIEFVAVSASRLTFAGLKRSLFVGSRQLDYARPYPVLRMLKSLGVVPERTMEANSQETQKRMVLEGLGYTILPRFMVKAELASGSLKAVSLPKKLATPLFMVRWKSRPLSAQGEFFAAEMKKALSIS